MITDIRDLLRDWDTRFKLFSGFLLIGVIALYPPLKTSGIIFYFIISLVFAFNPVVLKRIRGLFAALLPLLLVFIAIPVLMVVISAKGQIGENLLFGVMTAVKSVCIIMIMLYIIHTSTFSKILASLRYFHVPDIVLLLLMISHRYFFLFTHTAKELLRARTLRLYGKSHLKKITSALQVLIHKALDHGEEVYVAMRLRGAESSLPLLAGFKSRSRDYLLSGIIFILTFIPVLFM